MTTHACVSDNHIKYNTVVAFDLDVLLPFHRNDEFLPRAIESLAEAKGVKFHAILVDDREDKSINYLKSFAKLSSYQIIETSGNTGYGHSLQLASEYITSDCVALFNSDDLMHPDRFKIQMKHLLHSDINFTKMIRIGRNGRRKRSLTGTLESDKFCILYLLLGSYGANASWCARSSWWNENIFFDNFESLDWRIALKTFKKSVVTYSPEELYFYRKHGNQVTNYKKLSRDALQIIYNSWLDLCLELGLPTYSYNVFSMLALPWNRENSIEMNQYLDAVSEIKLLSKTYDFRIQSDIASLINRRSILALRSRGGLKSKATLGINGVSSIKGIVEDTVRNGFLG